MLFRVNSSYDQSSRRLFGFDNCIIDAAYRLFWSEMRSVVIWRRILVALIIISL